MLPKEYVEWESNIRPLPQQQHEEQRLILF